MKIAFTQIFFFAGIFLQNLGLLAQPPNAIPYQGVARNASGEVLASQAIGLQISLHDVTANGTVVYKETQNTTTTVLGLFTITIGVGTPITGTLASVNWGDGAKFVQIEMDASGNSNYVDMGTTQLNSVPFALYAKSTNAVPLPQGSAAGQVAYWTGNAWVLVPAGQPGQKLQISQSGIPNWTGALFATLSTTPISSNYYSTAASGGNITTDAGSPITSRGVCWSTAPNPTIANSKTINGTGTGTFTDTLTGLAESTTYYVRAYATNGAGTAYGNQQVFTSVGQGVPTLFTSEPYDIAYYNAQVTGTIVNTGGQPVTEQGICWSTHQNPTLADTRRFDDFPEFHPVSYTLGAYGNPSTTYFVRAYATNSLGTGYGNQVSFTTRDLTLPVLTTRPMYDITNSTAVSGGDISNDGGALITNQGVCYSTSPNPTTANNVVTAGAVYYFTCNLSGLATNTTYYLRAFATSVVGTAYGNQITFTSSPYTLGQSLGGGKIFYIDGTTGQHGFIAAPTDGPNSGNIRFYASSPMPYVAAGSALGSGFINTTNLSNAMGPASVPGQCKAYNGGGFTDWFLPSRDELAMMLTNRSYIGNTSNGVYWSSTQDEYYKVWVCDNSGVPFEATQYNIINYFYRPIRAF